MFECDKCGACCRNLDKSFLYDDLNRGDGVCRFLDGNLCTIYENRPYMCRVDDCYEKYFKDLMTIDLYYALNKKVCKKLKRTR